MLKLVTFVAQLHLLDLERPFVFFRLEVEPVEIVLDSRLGTSGGGGFLFEYDGEDCWLYEFVLTFGRM